MPQVVRYQRQNFVDAPTEVLKLVNDEADIGNDISPTDILSILSQNPKVTTWTGTQSPYGNVDWWPISVYFNNLKPPYTDKRVRWAIAYAIDQQAVIDTAFGGASEVVGHPFPNFPHLMTFVSGISDLLTTYNVLEFNLTKTNTLMTAAGFTKDGDGYWIDGSGVRPDANLYAPEQLFADIGPVIAQQLRMAGFDCSSVSPGTVWDDIANGTAALFLFGHGGSTYDPLDTFNLYRPENVLPIGQPGWGNLTRWSNPTFTYNANQMSAIAPDDPGMAALFHAGMAVWLDELPDCPICQWMHRIPMNTRYWVNFPNQTNPYVAPALWALTALVLVANVKMNLLYSTFLPVIKK
jgi:peptide/nickel transport system substrate-binding protein